MGWTMANVSVPQHIDELEHAATKLLCDTIIAGSGLSHLLVAKELAEDYEGLKDTPTFIGELKYDEPQRKRLMPSDRWHLAQIAREKGWLTSFACPPGVDASIWERAIAKGAYVQGFASSFERRTVAEYQSLAQSKKLIKDFQKARSKLTAASKHLEFVIHLLREFADPETSRRMHNHGLISPLLGWSIDVQDFHSVDLFLDELKETEAKWKHLCTILDDVNFIETTVGLPDSAFEIEGGVDDYFNEEFETGQIPALPSDPDVRQAILNQWESETALRDAKLFESKAWQASGLDNSSPAPSLPSKLAVSMLRVLISSWEARLTDIGDVEQAAQLDALPTSESARLQFRRKLLVAAELAYDSDSDAREHWHEIWMKQFAAPSLP